jgi:hypothetical protein
VGVQEAGQRGCGIVLKGGVFGAVGGREGGWVAVEVGESEIRHSYSRKIIVVFMRLKIIGVFSGDGRCNRL